MNICQVHPGPFGGLQEAKGIAAIGIDNCSQVELSRGHEHTNIKRILGKHFSDPTALNTPVNGLMKLREWKF